MPVSNKHAAPVDTVRPPASPKRHPHLAHLPYRARRQLRKIPNHFRVRRDALSCRQRLVPLRARQRFADAAVRAGADMALFDVARTAWAQAGKQSPHLATSFWFAIGDGDDARAQVHTHLRRYMNWIPAEYVDAMAPTTGWAGTEAELLEVLRGFEAIGADEIHLIPTSSDIYQVRRVADVVNEFQRLS